MTEATNKKAAILAKPLARLLRGVAAVATAAAVVAALIVISSRCRENVLLRKKHTTSCYINAIRLYESRDYKVQVCRWVSAWYIYSRHR